MNSEEKKPFGRIVVIVAVVIIVLVSLLEFIYLRGESVAYERIRVKEPFTFEVDAAGVPYLVDISAARDESVKLKILLNGPEGEEIFSRTELTGSRSRSFKFEPTKKGVYTLSLSESMTLRVGSGPYLRIRVYKNDRRILGPCLDKLTHFGF